MIEERVWLRELRQQANLSQERVANLVHTTEERYRAIEGGRLRPAPRLAKRIGDLLGFDWIRFLADDLQLESRSD